MKNLFTNWLNFGKGMELKININIIKITVLLLNNYPILDSSTVNTSID